MRSLILLMIWIAMASELAAQPGFKDHGIAAPATESRGMALIQDAAGHNLAIILTNDLSPRGFLLVVDLDQGKTEQIYYPEGVPNSPPFASLVSRNGRFLYGSRAHIAWNLIPPRVNFFSMAFPIPRQAAL